MKKKPKKPYKKFPLFAHQNGQWAKKLRGSLVYFGKWDDWKAALQKYELEVLGELRRQVDLDDSGMTIGDMLNLFMDSKQSALSNDEITEITLDDYQRYLKILIVFFGKHRSLKSLDLSPDWLLFRNHISKNRSFGSVKQIIQRVRTAFKWAYENGYLDKPMRYGTAMKSPPKKVLRRDANKRGARIFSAAQLRDCINNAKQPLKSMIYLGINCGFGNTDCSRLLTSNIDFENAWLDYPRPKTEVPRTCPLWPETIESIQEYMASKKRDTELVFVTKYGNQFGYRTNLRPIGAGFRKLLISINLHEEGLSFYRIRHTFETVAQTAKDQVSVNWIMGHVDPTMAGIYRHGVPRENLETVVDLVRNWLKTDETTPLRVS